MQLRAALCVTGLFLLGGVIYGCAGSTGADSASTDSTGAEPAALTAQMYPLPTWRTLVSTPVHRIPTWLTPVKATSIYDLSHPDSVSIGDVQINACADLQGATFPVACTVGALSCTCYVTMTSCTPNSSGNCDCDYTVNPTASNCH